jgi:[ribosomal protein S18]-alanine N-acetyltransferase
MRMASAVPRVLILPARPGDLRAVYRIAQASFPIPWPLEELRKELSRPFSSLRVLRPAPDAGVAAFMNYWRIDAELQIMNVAVAPAHRRRGYGSLLIEELITEAAGQRTSAIVLEVRRSNAVAIHLYQRHGFEGVGIRPRYYSDNGEDALVMRCELRRS